MIGGDDPAFPAPEWNISFVGMTLRDYFAAQVIGHLVNTAGTTYEQDALNAYKYADAMVRARNDDALRRVRERK